MREVDECLEVDYAAPHEAGYRYCPWGCGNGDVDPRSDFPEVPLDVLAGDQWVALAIGKFWRSEDILVLEGRVLLYAVRHAAHHSPSSVAILAQAFLAQGSAFVCV